MDRGRDGDEKEKRKREDDRAGANEMRGSQISPSRYRKRDGNKKNKKNWTSDR